MAHTPGPWGVRRYYEHGEPRGYTISAGSQVIADVPGLDAESEANAYLFAAAPALRDALEAIAVGLNNYVVLRHDVYVALCGGSTNVRYENIVFLLQDRARAALALADSTD